LRSQQECSGRISIVLRIRHGLCYVFSELATLRSRL
jgi:hypothetical protein